ncbi:MAG: glycosyltransferase family 4 protein [Mucilaginibacter sp.]|nr:glycosyltransferase family 4 protein [Mucilaginibacter sp.]
MKVAFVVRPNLYEIAGGDTVQIDQTAKQLIALGVEVDILTSNDVVPYERYDLLNFFHITRPSAILYHSKAAKIPFVISTIHCLYGNYYKYNEKGIASVFANFSEDTKDYLRTLSRWLLRKEPLPIGKYLFKGQRKSIIEALETANIILPNSLSELNRLKELYTSNVKDLVVTNGINPEKFPFDVTIKKDDDLVICVGRIEKRKNQLNLIKALNNSRYKLVLIGAASPNQIKYYQQCREAAGPNVTFLDRIPHDELLKYYQLAKVHVLASWFETTGLSSLEAAIMRCNIVITDKGDTRDYFGDDAFYCDPANTDSIKAAVEQASEAMFNEALLTRILTLHTWRKAAEQTLEAYQIAINNNILRPTQIV